MGIKKHKINRNIFQRGFTKTQVVFFVFSISLAIEAMLLILIPYYHNRKTIYIPKNINESFVELIKVLPKNELLEFKKTKEEDIISNYHMTLGRWIRARFGLWEDSRLANYFFKRGVRHPDDMSHIILIAFHRHLNKKDLKLSDEFSLLQAYWHDEKLFLKLLAKKHPELFNKFFSHQEKN